MDRQVIDVVKRIRRAQQISANETALEPITESLFKEVDSLANKVNNQALTIWTDTQIGFYYYRLSLLEKALPYFLKSSKVISTSNVTNYWINPADCLVKNAYFLGNIGDHDLAIGFLSNALNIKDTLLAPADSARIHFALEAEYLELGKPKEAKRHFIRSQAISRNKDASRYAKTLGELALLEQRGGNSGKAVKLLQEDIRLSAMNGDQRNTMFAKIRLARFYIENKTWNLAAPLLQDAEKFVASKDNLLGFDYEITQLQLSIAEHDDNYPLQLALYKHIRAIEGRLKYADGEEVALQVNLKLQRERMEWESLSQEAALKVVKIQGLALAVLCVLLLLVAFLVHQAKKRALKFQQMEFDNIITKIQLEKVKSEHKYDQAKQTIAS